jgi:nucleotide-binding universal stress UspA family protein
MAYRTILVSLNDATRLEQALALAAGLQEEHGAHIIGLFVIPAMQIYPTVGMEITPDVYEGHRAFFKDQAEKVKKRFNDMIAREGLSAELRIIDSASPLAADMVIDHGRYADLIVVTQVDREGEEGVELDFDERVVMEAGRPVLVLPRADLPKKLAKVLVGWNGTRESARALFDALPILKRADEATVVWVDPQRERDMAGVLAGADIAAILARHGVKVTSEPLATAGLNAGEALLQRARDGGADMLVMGAYGHSRMREFVFGGATRHVLRNAKIPVLMSH